MANETINIDILINASKSAKTLKEQRKALEDLKDGLDKVKTGSGAFELLTEEVDRLTSSMGNLNLKFEDVYGDIQPLTGRIGELEDRMYELALQGKQNTQEFITLQEELVKMKRTVKDVDDQVDAFTERGRGLNQVIGVVQGLAGAFAVAEGTMSLFGGENEQFEKTMTKLTSVMAIMNGLSELQNQLTERGTLLNRIYNMVLKANPYVLIASAIAVVVTAMIAFNDKIGQTIKSLKKQDEAVSKTITTLDKEIEKNKKLGLSIDELRKKRIDAYNERLRIAKAELKQQEEELYQTFKQYVEGTDAILGIIPTGIYQNVFGISADDVKEVESKLEETKQKILDIENSIIDEKETIKQEGEDKEIARQQRLIDLEKSRGTDTYKLEKQLLDYKIGLYNQDTEEYKDLVNQKKILEVEHNKFLKEELKKKTEERIEILKKEYSVRTTMIESLGKLSVKAGEISPKILDDLKELIAENKKFIDSITDSEEPLDNLQKTFKTLSENVKLYIKEYSTMDIYGNIEKTIIEGSGFIGDKFAQFYDDKREELIKAFTEGDVSGLEKLADDIQKTFNETFGGDEDFLTKQKTLTAVIEGYKNALGLISTETTKGLTKDLDSFFLTLRDKLILAGDVSFDEFKVDDLFSIIEQYNVDLDRLKSGTEGFNKEYNLLLDKLVEAETKRLKSLGKSKEEIKGVSEETKTFAKTQLDTFIKVVSETTKLEDGIRGISYEYQNLNNELNLQSKNFDLILGTVKGNIEALTKDFDVKKLSFKPEDFEKDLDVIAKLLEKYGLDSSIILKAGNEDKLKLVDIFNKKFNDKTKQGLSEAETLWVDYISNQLTQSLQLMDAIFTSMEDRRISAIERESDKRLEAIEAEKQAYLDSTVEKTNAEKFKEMKMAEFEAKRKIEEDKRNKAIAQAQYKGEIRKWEYSQAEAAVNLANALLKASPNAFLMGTTAALGITQLATIIANKPEPPKYAKGGLLNGPSHSQGGIQTPYGELEGGEAVINKKSTKMFLPILDQINQAYGGTPLMSKSKFATGGVLPQSQGIDTSKMEMLLERYMNRPIKTYVVSSDMTQAQTNDMKLKDRTSF